MTRQRGKVYIHLYPAFALLYSSFQPDDSGPNKSLSLMVPKLLLLAPWMGRFEVQLHRSIQAVTLRTLVGTLNICLAFPLRYDSSIQITALR